METGRRIVAPARSSLRDERESAAATLAMVARPALARESPRAPMKTITVWQIESGHPCTSYVPMKGEGAVCSNCGGEIGKGGARGLCPRCYRYAKRNDGKLPPVEKFGQGELTAQLVVRMSPSLLARFRAQCELEGTELSETVRQLIEMSLPPRQR